MSFTTQFFSTPLASLAKSVALLANRPNPASTFSTISPQLSLEQEDWQIFERFVFEPEDIELDVGTVS